jgi:hypothetical protein
VPATQIGQTLAFINWTLLTGLAVGIFAAVVLLRERTSATSGYLAFATACAVGFGALAYLSDQALPATLGQDSPVVTDPVWDVPRRVALVAFIALVSAALILRRVHLGAAMACAWAGLGAGVATLVFGALTWGNDAPGSVALLVQLAALAAGIGGFFAAMILGHWYLVTPKLPESPLILLTRVLVAVMAAQVVLFVAWTATGAGPADVAPFAVLVGPWALFVWLRLLVGLVFPLIVSVASVRTARTRSMESATGLLYINVGSVAAGTILAAGLYFGAGLLV